MIYETLLITGCGGDIGLALAEIARNDNIAHRLVGCDIHEEHPRSGVFDRCEVVPRADHSNYIDRICAIVAEHHVDAIVPMSEAELATLLQSRSLSVLAERPVIAANRMAVEIGLDKLATFRMLREQGFPAPWTRVVGEEAPAALPCVVKRRRGQGSKGFLRVTVDTVDQIAAERIGDLWQELILPDDQEYTCGLYRCLDGSVRTLVFRRRLQGGLTSMAQVVVNSEIETLLCKIAVALDLRGSINVQLRLDSKGPKVFEINPRFSSTVAFRHKLGFRDFVWSILESRGLRIESYCPPQPGTRVFRRGQEIVSC